MDNNNTSMSDVSDSKSLPTVVTSFWPESLSYNSKNN